MRYPAWHINIDERLQEYWNAIGEFSNRGLSLLALQENETDLLRTILIFTDARGVASDSFKRVIDLSEPENLGPRYGYILRVIICGGIIKRGMTHRRPNVLNMLQLLNDCHHEPGWVPNGYRLCARPAIKNIVTSISWW